MLLLSKELLDRPIISLRTGQAIAKTLQPIIDPNNLKIIGWWCSERGRKDSVVLLTDDVRESSNQGLAIDDHNALSEPEELVRLRSVLRIDFGLLGKTVRTKNHKIGKVTDYCYEPGSFVVQKLYVSQSIIKDFNKDILVVGRSQIIEITDHYIMVEDTEVKTSAKLHRPALKKVLLSTPSSAYSEVED